MARLVRSVAWAACLMLGLGTVSGAAQVESVVSGHMAAGVLVGSDVNRLKHLGMDDPRVELFLSLSPGGYLRPGNPVDAIAADLLMAGASASDVERFIGNHCQILDCRLSTRQVLASGVPYLSPFAPSHGESGMAITANTMDGIGLGLGLVQIAHLFGPSRPTVRTPVATNWGGEFVDDAIRAPATRPDFANISAKIERQMQTRGWTPDLIDEAVTSGSKFPAVNKLGGANTPATRYVSPTTGQSVVIDNATGEIIQVGGPGFKYGP